MNINTTEICSTAAPDVNAKAAKRYTHQTEPYRDRVKLAKKDALSGRGFEDLMVSHNISEALARHLVGFGR